MSCSRKLPGASRSVASGWGRHSRRARAPWRGPGGPVCSLRDQRRTNRTVQVPAAAQRCDPRSRTSRIMPSRASAMTTSQPSGWRAGTSARPGQRTHPGHELVGAGPCGGRQGVTSVAEVVDVGALHAEALRRRVLRRVEHRSAEGAAAWTTKHERVWVLGTLTRCLRSSSTTDSGMAMTADAGVGLGWTSQVGAIPQHERLLDDAKGGASAELSKRRARSGIVVARGMACRLAPPLPNLAGPTITLKETAISLQVVVVSPGGPRTIRRYRVRPGTQDGRPSWLRGLLPEGDSKADPDLPGQRASRR